VPLLLLRENQTFTRVTEVFDVPSRCECCSDGREKSADEPFVRARELLAGGTLAELKSARGLSQVQQFTFGNVARPVRPRARRGNERPHLIEHGNPRYAQRFFQPCRCGREGEMG